MLSFADILHPHVIEVKFDVKYVNEHPDSLSDIHSLIAQLNGLIENTLDEMLQDEVLQNTGDKDA